MDRERLVPKPRAAIELDAFHKRLDSHCIKPSAGLFRVGKSTKTYMRNTSWSAGGDISQELANHSLGQIIGFHLIPDSHFAKLWNQPPVSSNHALHQPMMCQMIQSTRAAIALPCCINQRQIAWFGRFQKPLFKSAG